LLVFLTAFGAWPRQWRWIGFTFFMFALGTVQIFLAPPDEDPASGWVHGLHGLGALLVFLLAAFLAYNDLRLLGLIRRAEAAAPAPPPPPAPPE
jgi:hypothetical protein